MAFACKLKLARGPQGFPTTGHVNEENVETYPIWPYEFFSVNRSAEGESVYPLAVGKNTFDGVHFPHGDSVGRPNITGIWVAFSQDSSDNCADRAGITVRRWRPY